MNLFHLKHAARILRNGGVIAHATEGVFGLGCDPFNAQAFGRLLELKGRRIGKGVILIGAAFEQLRGLTLPLPADIMREVQSSWPGPHTWLLPARPAVPRWLTGEHRTVAVRVTSHPQAAALCSLFGAPLVSTSANYSGRPPARTRFGLGRALRNRLDYVLPGCVGGATGPSEVRDALTGAVVRPARGLER